MKHAEAFMAISDPTRMKIIELLVQRNYCVGVLAELLGISAPAVSQHMKVCLQAGLVSSEKIGYHTHYQVNRDMLRDIAKELETLAAAETKPCEKRGTRCGRRGGGCQRSGCGMK